MTELPEEIVVEGQTWKLLPPAMYMRSHVGEITAPDGRVFEISTSLNGLSVYLETPFRMRDLKEPGNLMEFTAIYALQTGNTLKALAQSLIEMNPKEEAVARD